jgi:hypothetical protein
MASERSARHWRWGRIIVTVGVLASAAGAVLCCFEPTRVAGILVLCLSPSAVIGGNSMKVAARGGPEDPPLTDAWVRRTAFWLLPVALLGAVGLYVRQQPDYVGRYGIRVDADLGYTCETTTRIWGHTSSSSTECPVSYRTPGGEYQYGILRIARGDKIYFVDTVPAYALGGRLESVIRVGKVGPESVLGRYLPPFLLVGTGVEVVLLMVTLGILWTTRRRDNQPPADSRPQTWPDGTPINWDI